MRVVGNAIIYIGLFMLALAFTMSFFCGSNEKSEHIVIKFYRVLFLASLAVMAIGSVVTIMA